jgi:hypothetical protein
MAAVDLLGRPAGIGKKRERAPPPKKPEQHSPPPPPDALTLTTNTQSYQLIEGARSTTLEMTGVTNN